MGGLLKLLIYLKFVNTYSQFTKICKPINKLGSENMSKKIFTLGEALIDFVSKEAGRELKNVDYFFKAPGGAPANVAASTAKLGIETYFIGKVGQDAFGDFIIDTLTNAGVKNDCTLRTEKAKTGLSFVSLKNNGERDFMFYRSPSADMLLDKEDIDQKWFGKGDILHFGSISLIQNPSKEATETAIKYARENGSLVSFDPNIRLPLWNDKQKIVPTIMEYLPYADLVKISEEELKLLTNESDYSSVRQLFKGNVKMVLLTLGDKGAIAYTKERKVQLEGFKVKAVDTTGAGDAFVAGVLYELIKNNVHSDNFDQAIKSDKLIKNIILTGNANGALTTTKAGAISALPGLEDIQELIHSENTELNLLEKANREVWKNYNKVKLCPYRLNYHIMSPTNWINDPNGLIQFKGEYHVFYQHYPYSPEPGPMHWGHVVSKDLVHWKHLPIALAPDEDGSGCFSGSAVDNDGTLTLIYTSHNDFRDPKEFQCIAASSDGVHFEKYSGNPVIERPPKDASDDFRDPKVWRHGDKWYMVIGSGKDGMGKALLYSSENLIKWNYLGVAAESDGTQGDNWECPNLIELEDEDVLIVSPMNMKNGKNIFIAGKMDYKNNKFNQIACQEIDYGEDFYAAQGFKDDKGRAILIAWMDSWNKDHPTSKNGWAGAMTIPRELTIQNGKIISKPVDELKLLRTDGSEWNSFIAEQNKSGYLKGLEGDSLEIECEIKVMQDEGGKFGLILRASSDFKEQTLLYYDLKNKQLVLDKKMSGEGDKNKNAVSAGLQSDKILKLHLFIDKSSIETFVNGGEIVTSNRIYPKETSRYYDFFAEGCKVQVSSLKVWKIQSIWDNSNVFI